MNNFSFIDLGEESWLIEILWFLPALIYCYLLLWLLVVCKGQVFGCILIPILLACRLVVMGSRANINWHYYNNFLLTGMPFVLLGYYLAINKERILSKKLLAINVFLLISGSLIVINKGGRDGYIGVIMVSIAVLCIAQLYPHRYIPVLETVGKKMSFEIYVGHVFWIWIINTIVDNSSDLKHNLNYLYLKPILVVALTVLGIGLKGYLYKKNVRYIDMQ